MIKTKNTKMAAVALLATVAFAGCGDDKTEATAPAATAPAATAPASSSPAEASSPVTTSGGGGSANASWANQLCTQLAAKAKPITPPNVQATTPEDTQKSLVTFFTSVVDQLGSQIEIIETVGAPPGPNAAKEWESAVKDLRDIRKKVAKVTRSVKAANATNQKELQAVIADLGEQMQVLSSYQGPVKDLAKKKALAPAINGEPACEKVSGA